MPTLWCKYTCWTVLCCSSKPTGGSGGPFGQENALKSGHFNHKNITVPSDWMCNSCGCVNFARRTSCFQVWIFVYYPWFYITVFLYLGCGDQRKFYEYSPICFYFLLLVIIHKGSGSCPWPPSPPCSYNRCHLS